jgi:hypothetical protein
MIDYLELLAVLVITLGLVKVLPTRWFSREEKFRYESKKRLKEKLR